MAIGKLKEYPELEKARDNFIKNDPIVKPLDTKPVYSMSMHSKDYVCVMGAQMRRAFDAGVLAERRRIKRSLK